MKIQSVVGVVAFLSVSAFAAAEKKEVSFGGFIDTYYGFDFNEPAGDRSFTTAAVRPNEFSVNLAHVEMKLEAERVRGRIALQGGSSVNTNYSSELRSGPAQGPELADIMRHIQEAYGGFRLSENLWVDAGIFLSHIGAESFLSKDNWNYTRSLGADYSPYYQAGIRLNYQWSPKWAAGFHLMNGWQNVIETNSDKAIGVQLAYSPTDAISVTYNNFIGREREFRFYNNLIVKAKLSERWSFSFSSDIGFQKRSGASDFSVWFVETLLTQYRLTDTIAIGGRLEYFHDKDQVVVTTTGTPNGFQTAGASLNVDWQPQPGFLFRNEIRSLFSKDAVFPGQSGTKSSNTLFVTSMAVSF
jgi:hypothetical protein